jgi:hypothetical protein
MKINNKVVHKWRLIDFLKDKYLYITLVVSCLVAYFINGEYLRHIITTAGSAMVQMSGALLGIVLASLAIFVVFLNKRYVGLIEQLIGFENEFFAIKTVTVLTILCLVFGLGLIVFSEYSDLVLRLIFGVALWIFLYLLEQIWELVKWLIEHAKARAMQVQEEDNERNE